MRRPNRPHHILSDFHEAYGVTHIMLMDIIAVRKPTMPVLTLSGLKVACSACTRQYITTDVPSVNEASPMMYQTLTGFSAAVLVWDAALITLTACTWKRS